MAMLMNGEIVVMPLLDALALQGKQKQYNNDNTNGKNKKRNVYSIKN
jgi:hypothetical protein